MITKVVIGVLAGWTLAEAYYLAVDQRYKRAIGYGILGMVLAAVLFSI